MWYHTPITSDTWEAEAEKLQVQVQLQQLNETLSQYKIFKGLEM